MIQTQVGASLVGIGQIFFPSGDIATAEIGFSVGFEVKRCGVASGFDILDRDARCHANHPTTSPASTKIIRPAPATCHFLVEGGVPMLAGTWVEILPVSVSRFRRLRSALSSAAD